MRVSQSDIVEVMFPLLNGQLKPHPAIIISNREVFEVEGVYIMVMLSTKNYNDEFIYEIHPKMVNYQSDRVSYAKLQLIETFDADEVMQRFGSLKSEHFKELLKKLNQSVFSFGLNP